MNNWAIMDIEYFPSLPNLIIHAVTNVPCTLTLYLSDNPPLTHKTSRAIRGVSTMWSAYWCFTAATPYASIETVDSIDHWFIIPGWAICVPRYFCFKATINGLDTPSISPIFTYHVPWGTVDLYFPAIATPGGLWETSTISYLNCHNAPGSEYPSDTWPGPWTIGQAQTTPSRWYIYRAGLFFDTSTLLPTTEIKFAWLDLYGYSMNAATHFFIDIVDGSVLHNPMIKTDYGALRFQTALAGWLPSTSWQLEKYNSIPLNTYGLSLINKGQLTKLALRSGRDIGFDPPLGINIGEIVSFWDTISPINVIPRLHILANVTPP